MRLIKSKVYLSLSIGYMVLIFYLSSISIPETFIFWFDPYKLIMHFFEFGILAFLWYLTSLNKLFSFLMTTSYGIFDEIHQYFVPRRIADPLDALFDSLGALSFVLIAEYLTKKKLILEAP
ncbi:MAG: VanZ family protein [Candidatus Aenigmarchaeota archaeon]|nr:VanZ family protein [Candidatus Aenigmarchaeota archaeon]